MFDNIADGIKHFAEITGVKADKVPSPEEIEEIKREEESLPPRPLDWTFTGTDAALAAHQQMQRRAHIAAMSPGSGLPFEQSGSS